MELTLLLTPGERGGGLSREFRSFVCMVPTLPLLAVVDLRIRLGAVCVCVCVCACVCVRACVRACV